MTVVQPEIVPSALANRKRLDAETPFSEITNPAPPLKTVPVGALPECSAERTVTTSEKGSPRPSRMSETPLPLSLNQNGPVGLKARPQGLTRFGSVTRANPG